MPFKAGHDANRYTQNDGIMVFHKELSELLRDHSLDAISLLVDTMKDKKVSSKLRVVCARDILDRAHGRPIDCQVMVAIGADNMKDVNAMTDSELEALARTLTTHTTGDEENTIIDGEYTETTPD